MISSISVSFLKTANVNVSRPGSGLSLPRKLLGFAWVNMNLKWHCVGSTPARSKYSVQRACRSPPSVHFPLHPRRVKLGTSNVICLTDNRILNQLALLRDTKAKNCKNSLSSNGTANRPCTLWQTTQTPPRPLIFGHHPPTLHRQSGQRPLEHPRRPRRRQARNKPSVQSL